MTEEDRNRDRVIENNLFQNKSKKLSAHFPYSLEFCQ